MTRWILPIVIGSLFIIGAGIQRDQDIISWPTLLACVCYIAAYELIDYFGDLRVKEFVAELRRKR